MVKFLIFLLEIKRHRLQIFAPLVLLPLVALLWSLSKQPVYEATATLHLDRENVQSPLLKNLNAPEHSEILNRILKSPDLLFETLAETSGKETENIPAQKTVRLARSLSLHVLSPNLIRLSIKGKQADTLGNTLEAHANGFIYELLSPERLRLQHALPQLEEQIAFYASEKLQAEQALEKLGRLQLAREAQESHPQNETQEAENDTLMRDIVENEFRLERAAAQLDLTRASYEQLLARDKMLNAQFSKQSPNTLLWFVEPPALTPMQPPVAGHIEAMLHAVLLSIFLSLFLILYKHFSARSLEKDEDIRAALGLKILGHIPNLGDVRVEDDRLTADIRGTL